MKFLVDACAGRSIARVLRARGHDVAETLDRGSDPGDETVLEWAMQEGRTLVTMDKDFGALIYARRKPHAGLIRLPHVPRAERVRLLEHVLATVVAGEIERAIVTVRGSRVLIARPPTGDR